MRLVVIAIISLILGMGGSVFAKPSSLQPTSFLMPGGEGGTGFDDLNFVSSLHKVLVPGGRTGKLYLIDSRTKEISTIDGFSVEGKYVGGHRQSITSADEGGGFIFTTDRSALRIYAIDPDSKSTVYSARLSSEPDYVRFIESAGEVWVTQPGSEQIEVFKFLTKPTPTLTQSRFIKIPGGPESLIVDHTSQRAYTHLWGGKTVEIDIHTHAIINQWPNACIGSRGIALDEKHGFLFAGCAEGKAVVLDLKHNGVQLASLSTGSGVDVIDYNTALSHLYLSGADSATLSVIRVSEQGKLFLLGMGEAVQGAHCTAGDDQGNIWVCDPRHGQLLLYKDNF